jgi:hypothetical protein
MVRFAFGVYWSSHKGGRRKDVVEQLSKRLFVWWYPILFAYRLGLQDIIVKANPKNPLSALPPHERRSHDSVWFASRLDFSEGRSIV